MGLLLLRAVAGIAMVSYSAMALHVDPPVVSIIPLGAHWSFRNIIVFGLWTPIAGTLVAIDASSSAFLHRADFLNWFFIGALGAALALLGPGG